MSEATNSRIEGSCYFSENTIEQRPYEPYLYYFIGALCTIKAITFYIEMRQLNKYKETKPDRNLSDFFTKKEFLDSQKYQHEKKRFKMVELVYEVTIDLSFWLLFFWVGVWNKVDHVMVSLSLCSDTPYINDIKQAYIFIVCASLLEHAYTLPFTWYDTFVIEERYGFNKTTVSTFVKD